MPWARTLIRAGLRAALPRPLLGRQREGNAEQAGQVVDCASQRLTALEIHEDNGYMAKRAM